MDTALYERFRKLVHAESGIELTDSKESLVAARIAPRMKALGIERADRYLELLKDQHAGELTHFLDAISTNFTHFFREPEHFEVLAAECKRAVARGAPEFRVWCAASSSGGVRFATSSSATPCRCCGSGTRGRVGRRVTPALLNPTPASSGRCR